MDRRPFAVLALLALCAGCDDGDQSVDPPPDGSADAGLSDGSMDTGLADARVDRMDAGVDAARVDDGVDAARVDGGTDEGVDLRMDEGVDHRVELDMTVDADAGCVPDPVDVDLESSRFTQGSTRGRDLLATDCAPARTPGITLRWAAPEAGVWRFDTGGSGFDTILQVELDTCDAEPVCNSDRTATDPRSMVELEVEAGAAVRITVAGQRVWHEGDYILHITPAEPPAPSYVGDAALAVLRASHAEDEGSTWNLTTDGVLPLDWVVLLPDTDAWGLTSGLIEAAPGVPEGAPPDSFHPEFMLPYCVDDADCPIGRCLPAAATVEAVGQMLRMLCMGYGDHVWNDMYAALARARRVADVSSLDFPDNSIGVEPVTRGRFLIALRNALRYLHSTGEPVQVRFMFGWLVNDLDFDDWLEARVQALTDGVPANTALRLYFGGMNYRLLSWNHSKIIAADGESVLQGGINFYSTDYLGASPVQDVSMWIHGGPARDAHRYLDAIWATFDDQHGGLLGDLDGTSTALVTLPGDLDPPGAAELPPAAEPHVGLPVLSLGRLGLIDRAGVREPAPSDDAMWAAIAAARESLVFSLQDLGSVRDGLIVDLPVVGEVDLSYGWPERLMHILARRLLAGVSVQIVISEVGAGAYSYGWTKREALDAWRAVIEADAELAAEVVAADGTVADFLCNRVDFASVRADEEADAWADGSAMGNHSKFWIVDDRAVYIGSQNLYLSNLFEWGLLIDDPGAALQVKREYWTPLWTASRRTAVSGPAAEGRCVLRD
jgi:phosphatidylserine/phosphatidylglycerophosphate/cardiolipin synthase-like enzyme